MVHLISDRRYKGKKICKTWQFPVLNFLRFVLTHFSSLGEDPSMAGPPYPLSSTLPSFVLSKELLRVNATLPKNYRIK